MGHSSNHAAEAANTAERERQSQIGATQARINQVFDNPKRQRDIREFVNATREYYNRDLTRQKADADRNLTFTLARQGLTGGSTNVDQQRLLGEQYSRGVLKAEQQAQQAGAGLESQDQQARSRLIGLATSGLDATTGAQQAAAAMRTNIEAAGPEAKANALGNAFATTGNFVKQAKDAQAFRDSYMQTIGGKRAALYGTPSMSGYGGR
jgi:hypothetical protein